MTRTTPSEARTRLKSAKATLRDLEERRNANLSLHRYTGKAKYERAAFLLEDGISRARRSVAAARADLAKAAAALGIVLSIVGCSRAERATESEPHCWTEGLMSMPLDTATAQFVARDGRLFVCGLTKERRRARCYLLEAGKEISGCMGQ